MVDSLNGGANASRPSMDHDSDGPQGAGGHLPTTVEGRHSPSGGGAGANPIGDVFDQMLSRSSTIYRGNPDVLREAHVPARLPHREDELRRIAHVLAPALRGQGPANLLIYGKIGSGKTAVVTQVRQEISRRTNLPSRISFVTVNCATVDTPYALLQTLGNALIENDEERIPTGWSLDRVYQALCAACDARGGTIFVVLDEIDKFVQKSRDDVLYALAQINTELKGARVGLIGISNDLKFTENLDARIRSRLNEEKILFSPYDALQLKDILRDRAQEVFAPEALEPGVIERCAAYAAQESGDARRALALLRLSAQLAERAGLSVVREEHVIKAKGRLETDIIVECVRNLPLHAKILLWTVVACCERRRTSLPSGEVYENYASLCKRLNVTPLQNRSISNHVGELETLGLIHAAVISRGRAGRTREISVAVPPQETLHALEEDEALKPLSRQRSLSQTSLFRFDAPP